MKIKELYEYLCSLYPLETACDFDNSGFLVGDLNCDLTGVVICLDCTKTAIATAIKNGCNLILTHHPVIFNPLKQVVKEDTVYKLIENGISVISLHTNLDCGDGGVNDTLAKALGLKNIKKIACEDGFSIRIGELEKCIDADAFAKHINKKLGANIRYCGNNNIKRVAVCSGSGSEFLMLSKQNGADAFVTSECKHHLFLLAEENGIMLADAGHFNTEDIIIEPLRFLIETQFNDLKIITEHYTPIKECP